MNFATPLLIHSNSNPIIAKSIHNLMYFRVVRELEAVKQEAAILKDQMTNVKHDIEKVCIVKF